MAARRTDQEEPDAEDATLLAGLRAQNPAVLRPLWARHAPLVLRVLPLSLREGRGSVEAAAEEVFLQLFRWGPRLRLDSDLKMLVVRAIARTVERLSRPPRSSRSRRKASRTHRARADAAD